MLLLPDSCAAARVGRVCTEALGGAVLLGRCPVVVAGRSKLRRISGSCAGVGGGVSSRGLRPAEGADATVNAVRMLSGSCSSGRPGGVKAGAEHAVAGWGTAAACTSGSRSGGVSSRGLRPAEGADRTVNAGLMLSASGSCGAGCRLEARADEALQAAAGCGRSSSLSESSGSRGGGGSSRGLSPAEGAGGKEAAADGAMVPSFSASSGGAAGWCSREGGNTGRGSSPAEGEH